MMSVTISLGAWRSVFAFPSKNVDEGLKFSDGVKLKVLLYVLRNADRELDNKDISACTGVNVTDIPEALEYWVNMGILKKTDQTYMPVESSENNSTTAADMKIKAETPPPAETEKTHFTVTKPQKPDYVFTVQQLAVDEELKILVSEVQSALGKTLSNADIATLLMLKDTCGLPLDVILMLVQYAISIDKANMRTIERLGVSWANEGVDSVEAADNKIRLASQRTKCYSVVASAFGLNNAGSPTKKQLDYSHIWVSEWKFSPEMLREAYERCVDTKGEMKFNYIDGILKRWHHNGICNKNDLAASETLKQEKKSSSNTGSYDIEELEQINTLDDYQ